MIVCFQMLIRAAPLRPGLFLIEALQSGAQLAADQLAVPTCVSECSRSCWRRLFYRPCSRHVLLRYFTAVEARLREGVCVFKPT